MNLARYLNPKGSIPTVSTFKKGENPEVFKVRIQPGSEVPGDVLPASDDEGIAGQEDG